jgi:(2Fe-2S) ferredoxin
LPAIQVDPEPASEKPTSDPPTTATTIPPTPSDPTPIPTGLSSSPYPHDTLILLCSHRRRDARCGISAPILRKEFERQLHPLGLWRDLNDNRPGGAKVVFINHVGGHKFAANVIIYRKQPGQADGEGLQGIWLARVMPKHVEGIVKYTILQGKIVHPDMIRGGFNRLTGGTSW